LPEVWIAAPSSVPKLIDRGGPRVPQTAEELARAEKELLAEFEEEEAEEARKRKRRGKRSG